MSLAADVMISQAELNKPMDDPGKINATRAQMADVLAAKIDPALQARLPADVTSGSSTSIEGVTLVQWRKVAAAASILDGTPASAVLGSTMHAIALLTRVLQAFLGTALPTTVIEVSSVR